MRFFVSHRQLVCFVSVILFFQVSFLFAEHTIQLIDKAQNLQLTLPVEVRDEMIYISAEVLAKNLNLPYAYYESNKKAVIRAGAKSIKLTEVNSFLMIDSDAYQMPVPTINIHGVLYAPLAIFLNVAGFCLPEPVQWDPFTNTLTVLRRGYNITSIDVEGMANGALIRLRTNKDFQVTDVSTYIRNGWLNVTILGGRVDTLQLSSKQPIGIVKQIAAYQFSSSSQISFLLDRKVKEPKVFVQSGEILISLRSAGASTETPPAASMEDRSKWFIDKIIIDPGHGGKDPGAIGKSGLKEKDVNLDIALRLRQLLRDRLHVEVLMTRDSDTYPTLQERTKFANTHDGKLFISIHANTNPNRSVRGVSTYLLGNNRTEEALAVAEKENSVIELEEDTEAYKEMANAAHILNTIAQSSYLKESEDLAQIVNRNISQKTKIPNIGVHQSGLYVLMGAAMPRILIETAFISNKEEESLLRSNLFKRKVAEAIFESIKEFKENCERAIGR